MEDNQYKTRPDDIFLPPKPDEPELCRAARTGDHNAIRAIAARGCDLNAEFDLARDGQRSRPATPLMVAAGSGDGATEETVKLLIKLGAEPTRRTKLGSAAMLACTGLGRNERPGGDAARLRAVIDAGCLLNVAGSRGVSLLAAVANLGDPGRLQILLELGASANTIMGDKERVRAAGRLRIPTSDLVPGALSGLEGATELGEMMRESMKEVHRAMAERLASGRSAYEIPLFAAAASGSAECIKLLLHAGADPNQLDNCNHNALFEAASGDAVRELVQAGTRMYVFDEHGRDVLTHHLEEFDPERGDGRPRREVIETLIRLGCPLESAGRNRLFDAAFSENQHAVQLLLDLGHPVSPDPDGRTALHGICWHWDHGDERDIATRAIVRMLLEAGIDPNARHARGSTPLHEALTGDGLNIVAAEELLNAGADINAIDFDGNTPLMLHYEVLFDYLKVTEFMLARGANPLVRNARGKTIVDLARERIAGAEPDWRAEQWTEAGGPPCGWKPPAEETDEEHRALSLLEDAVTRWSERGDG